MAREMAPTDGPNPLTEIAAFKEFTKNVKDRCDEPPVTTVISGIGYYTAK